MITFAALIILIFSNECVTLRLADHNDSRSENYDNEIIQFARRTLNNEVPILAVDVDGIGFTHGDIHHDIRLNGEPRSGTTQLEHIIYNLLMNVCIVSENCTLKRSGIRGLSVDTMDSIIEFNGKLGKYHIPEVGHRENTDFSNPPSLYPVQIKRRAHWLLNHSTPERLWFAIFRDPRSVILSLSSNRRDGPVKDAYILQHITRLSKWINLRYTFWTEVKNLDAEKVKILFFEDLEEHPRMMIREISEFLGLPTDDQLVHTVQNESSILGKNGRLDICHFFKKVPANVAAQATLAMNQVLSPILQEKWDCPDMHSV